MAGEPGLDMDPSKYGNDVSRIIMSMHVQVETNHLIPPLHMSMLILNS